MFGTRMFRFLPFCCVLKRKNAVEIVNQISVFRRLTAGFMWSFTESDAALLSLCDVHSRILSDRCSISAGFCVSFQFVI